MKKLTILIPCYNEEKGLPKVLENIPYNKLEAFGYSTDVIVIDNNSTDNTTEIAKRYGARVLYEPKQGKGFAMLNGFQNLPKDSDVVAMIDGDNSYKITEILRLIEPIDSGFCDVVLGTRLNGKIADNSMSFFNRTGNWLFTFLVRLGFRGNVTDVCTGFFAWKKPVLEILWPHLKSNGFSIEMEMIAKMAKLNFDMYSVPISYVPREGHSSLHPIKDGYNILSTWLTCLFWQPDESKLKKLMNKSSKIVSESIKDIITIFL